MFNNQTRARVPSPAALRALYQLAYISSGTAVGIAALCAEERRRRAVILQRIADNARLIRQSPRHVRNVIPAPNDDLRDAPDCETDRSDGNMRRHIASGTKVRSPELPSAVEKGYDQVTTRSRRRRGRQLSPDKTVQTRNTREDLSQASTRTSRNPSGRARFSTISFNDDSRISSSVHSTNPRLELNVPSFPERDIPELLKLEAAHYAKSRPRADKKQQKPDVSQPLLEEALEHGAFRKVISIAYSRYHKQVWTPDNLRQVVAACRNFSSFEDKDSVLQFYHELVESDLFRVVPLPVQSHLAFSLALTLLSWRSKVSNSKIINHLLGRIVKEHKESTVFFAELNQSCHRLLAEGQATAAADMIIGVMKFARKVIFKPNDAETENLMGPLLSCADLVFDAVYSEGNFSACTKLLMVQRKHSLKRNASLSRYEQFIHLCNDKNWYQSLGFIIYSSESSTWLDWLIGGIDPYARMALASACMEDTVFPHDTFAKLCRAIPHDLWATDCEAQDSSRSVQRFGVTGQFHEYSQDDRVNSKNISRKTAMVEMALRANQPDKAIELVRSFEQSGMAECHMLCFTAVAMAKRKSWSKVNKILNLMFEQGSFVDDVLSTRQLHQLARLFSLQHAGERTWAFVVSLVDRFRFVPTRSVTIDLFKCFVTSKAVDLIPKWLDYLRSIGIKFHLDSDVAALIFERFYLSQRPTHVRLMQLCDTLLHQVPRLNGSRFISVIKESIAYDMRKASGKNRSVVQERAERSLEKLVESTFAISEYPQQLRSDEVGDVGWDRDFEYTPIEVVIRRIYENRHGCNQGGKSHGATGLDIVVAFSRNDYQRVLDLYVKGLDANGIPLLPLTLEIAVEASLRRCGGNASEAEAILSDATRAGMDVTCAMGPIILHRMYHLTSEGKRNFEWLYNTAMAYSRNRDEKGWEVRQFIGTSAASILVDNGLPSEGISLLNAVFRMGESREHVYDIVAMTIYVKAYGLLKSVKGMSWVVNKVLDEQLRIDRRFTDAILRSISHFEQIDSCGGRDFERNSDDVQQIMELRKLCLERRTEQSRDGEAFGQKLVSCIVQLSKS